MPRAIKVYHSTNELVSSSALSHFGYHGTIAQPHFATATQETESTLFPVRIASHFASPRWH